MKPQGLLLDLIDHDCLFNMVGTTVETSIRTFSKLKKDGLVIDTDGKFIIKNIDKLSELSS